MSKMAWLVFFNILDLAGINAHILHKETMGEEISRKFFLFKLAEELGTKYQKERLLSKECSSETITNTAIDASGWKACQVR